MLADSMLMIKHAASGGFTPADVSRNWGYDFTDLSQVFQDSAKTTPVTADGQVVGGVIDSANGIDLIQATSTLKPLWKSNQINGLGGILTDGVDDWIENTGGLVVQPHEIWMVMGIQTYQGAGRIAGDRAYASGASTGISEAYNISTISISAGASINFSIGAGFNVYRIIFNGASSSLTLNNGTPTVGDISTDGINGVRIGADRNGNNPSNILMCEYHDTAALSSANVTNMWSYFSTKYGLF